jgi:2-dehydropantoate 2-reductase
MGTIRDHPATWEFCLGVMREVLTVGRAYGIALTDAHLDNAIALNRRMAAGAFGSMYHDLLAGRPLELDALNGAVARLGRERGVPTPHNDAIYAALVPYRDGTP